MPGTVVRKMMFVVVSGAAAVIMPLADGPSGRTTLTEWISIPLVRLN